MQMPFMQNNSALLAEMIEQHAVLKAKIDTLAGAERKTDPASSQAVGCQANATAMDKIEDTITMAQDALQQAVDGVAIAKL